MGLNELIYRRQPDGTYKWDGEILTVAAEYQLQCENSRQPFGEFTLEKAKEILEKGPLKQDWYKIIPVPDKELSGAAAKQVKRREAKIASGEIQERPKKLCSVCNLPLKGKAATAGAHRKCLDPNAKSGYQPKPLTDEEQARIKELMVANSVDEVAAKKLLRTEQRKARLSASREKAQGNSPVGKSTLDQEKIVAMHTNGCSVGEIAKALGASYMGIRNRLIKAGRITKSE